MHQQHSNRPLETAVNATHFEVTELSHSFGGLNALTDFSLEIFPGELVGLIGPTAPAKPRVQSHHRVFPMPRPIIFQGQDISVWRSTASPPPASPGPFRISACSRS